MKQLKSIILFVLFILINTLCSRSNNVENSTENSNDYSSTIVDLKENSENINTSFFVSAEIDSLFLNEICERRSRSRQILWNASWNFVRSLFALF